VLSLRALKTMDRAFPLLAAWTEVPAAVTLMVPEIAMLFPFWRSAIRSVNGAFSPKTWGDKIRRMTTATETERKRRYGALRTNRPKRPTYRRGNSEKRFEGRNK